MASRLYNIVCIFALGFIITISVLLKSFALKVTSDFTNFPDSKILFKWLLILKLEILKKFQKRHRIGIFQIIKCMILFMTPVTEGYSVIQIQSKRYEILKRENVVSLQVLVGSAQDTAFIIPFFYILNPVLILFGVSHFVNVFAFFNVNPFIFCCHGNPHFKNKGSYLY